ncbi:sigma-54 dependent transcriptional regulator [bacterium]|nr:sigma-54 dependent transcriptional regulator [bacterium]
MRVLVLDDQRVMVEMLRRLLAGHGWDVTGAHDLEQARDAFRADEFDLLLADVYLAEENSLPFVSEMRAQKPGLCCVVISIEDTETLATKAREAGADAFLSKPLSEQALLFTVNKVMESRAQRLRTADLERQLTRVYHSPIFPPVVTRSDRMNSIMDLARSVSDELVPVLISGESGTGKELVARAVHELGSRMQRPFVELNCAAIPATLAESELFGHEKGAFTGALARHKGRLEQADGGTLFLDEIGELPLETQPKLLRALQEKQFTRVGGVTSTRSDFRLICATNRDLLNEVRAGRFREDLYYRVVVFPIVLPALRERLEDIEPLLAHFFAESDREPPVIDSDAMDALRSYHWPGNIRELRNFAQAAQVLSVASGRIDMRTVRKILPGLGSVPSTRHFVEGDVPGRRPVRKLADVEREEILHALSYFEGDVTRAAVELGMGRTTLYRYLKDHGISPQDYSS